MLFSLRLKISKTRFMWIQTILCRLNRFPGKEGQKKSPFREPKKTPKQDKNKQN